MPRWRRVAATLDVPVRSPEIDLASMSTTAIQPPPPPPSIPESPRPSRPQEPSRVRVGALVAGGLAALVAIALIGLGGFGLWADGQKDGDGFVSTSTERFTTSTHALRTENLDIDLDGPGWLTSSDAFGSARLEATARNDKRIFVGVARTEDVERYLSRAGHATVTDIHSSPFKADYRTSPGGAPATEPWEQEFWAAASYGTGTRELTWDVDSGDWSVVVMNADGSPGVDAGVRAGAELPFLPALAWSFLGGGIVLLVAAGGLFYLGAGRPRPRALAP
jgi:hypothetical protein